MNITDLVNFRFIITDEMKADFRDVIIIRQMLEEKDSILSDDDRVKFQIETKLVLDFSSYASFSKLKTTKNKLNFTTNLWTNRQKNNRGISNSNLSLFFILNIRLFSFY